MQKEAIPPCFLTLDRDICRPKKKKKKKRQPFMMVYILQHNIQNNCVLHEAFQRNCKVSEPDIVNFMVAL